MVSDALTEPVLRRLAAEGITSFLGQSEGFEAVLRPGLASILSNEPVADFNYLVAGAGVEPGRFADACHRCQERDLPFLAILFPEAGDEVAEIARSLGLTHAVEFPFMVREDTPIEPSGNEAVLVRRVEAEPAVLGAVRVISSAFDAPEDSTRRVVTPALVVGPGLDIFVASIEGEVVGTVTLIHHGDTSGVWSMGTDPELQGQGIGRRLLSTVLHDRRAQGAARFFLGATPAGLPLYQKLGFETRVVASAWVSGATSQA